MKLNTFKNKGSTIMQVIASVAIASATIPPVMDASARAAMTHSAAALNNAAAWYNASGGRIPVGMETRELIEFLQGNHQIEGHLARGPWIHQQSEPKFTTVGYRIIRDMDTGNFKVIHSETEGQPGFVGF